MKFSITEKDEWNRFLDIIAISFREDFGKDIPLKITASDDQFISLMYSGSIYLELKMDAMVEEEGELCVQPEMFSVSGRITKEQIDFSTTGNIVKIKQDKHLNKTITVKSREAGYQPKTNQLFPVNMLELKEGIAATSFILSATKNEGNNFDCIRIDPLESGIAFITTDGHRIVKYKSNIISPFNKSLFIARKFIKIVSDPSLKIKGVIKTALLRGFISYSNYKFYDSEDNMIIEVSRNQDEITALSEYLSTNKGKDMYDYLLSCIN